MDRIENLIKQVEPEDEVDEAEIRSSYTALTSNPNIYAVQIRRESMLITTKDILITNNAEQSINLGRINLEIFHNGRYQFTRDESSERDPSIDHRRVHPHVSDSGGLCQGDAATTITRLVTDRNLSMLVSFMWEFLHMYNSGDSYWKLLFTKPCEGCAGDDCIACPCFKCDHKQGDVCRGCDRLRELSVNHGITNISRVLNGLTGDEDERIKLIIKLKDVIEEERDMKVSAHV